MSVSVKSENNLFQMTSYCAPLAGGGIGISLFYVYQIATLALSSQGSSPLSDLFNVFIFFILASLGLPRRLTVDFKSGIFTFEIFSFFGKRTLKGRTRDIEKVIVSGEGDGNAPTAGGLKMRGGTLYVYNLYAYLLSPKRHRDAMKQLQSKW